MDTAQGSHMPATDDGRATDDRLIRELLQNWVVWRGSGCAASGIRTGA